MTKIYTQLSLKEREEIFLQRKNQRSLDWIASKINRSKSTISRELNRNTENEELGYLPDRANEMAKNRKFKQERLVDKKPKTKDFIIEKLKSGWSPEAISGRAKVDIDIPFQMSTETIYQFVYSKEGKSLGLYFFLMRKKPRRGKLYGRKPRAITIPNRISIHERPKKIDSREEFGHCESDLTFNKGDQSTNLCVTVERKTRFTFLIKNLSKKSATTMQNLFNKLAQVPHQARKSVTFDNGGEFAKHSLLKKFMGIDTYFCDPGSPWQKGQVERTNAMLHRYISKSSSIKDLTEESVEWAQDMINNLPRKCLNWKTPAEAFAKEVAMINR